MSSPRETIRIAHTARCKLSLAANAPDRNFRFILGHALTLDKMMLRVAQIEMDSSDDGDEEGVANDEPHGPPTSTRDRRVSFSATSRAKHDVSSAAKEQDRKQRRSPPPARLPHPEEDEDEDEGEEEEEEEEEDDDNAVEDDEDDDALSLQRFPSASAQPPRMVEDEGYDDTDEPVTPTDEDLRAVMEGKSNEELTEAYQHLAECKCHGENAPMASQVWEMPQKEGHGRMAVMQVV